MNTLENAVVLHGVKWYMLPTLYHSMNAKDTFLLDIELEVFCTSGRTTKAVRIGGKNRPMIKQVKMPILLQIICDFLCIQKSKIS